MEKNNTEENLDEINKETDEASISSVNLDKYKDLDGLTLKKLNFGLWYLEHKTILLKSLYVFLGIIGFLTWFSFFKTFGHYVLIGMKEDERLISDMVNNPGIVHERVLETAAHPIQVASADVLLNSSGTYDIISKIVNTNKRYYSVFSYTVNINGEILGPFEDFILPSEEKFLIVLDKSLSRRPSSVKIDIENSWNKLDGHKIKDWELYRNNYINFSVENKSFSNPKESNLSEKLNLSVVEFDIKNNSAYSYYHIDLDILLYSNQSLVSVTKLPLDRFLSGETRHINITWPSKVVRTDSIIVIPNINIMADDIMFVP